MKDSVRHEPDDPFFRLLPNPCLELDATGTIVWANAAFCAMSGRDDQDFRALGLLTVIAEPSRKDVARELMVAMTRDMSSFEAPLVRPDGELRWLQWRGVRLPEKQLLRYLLHDITEFRQLAELAQEKERFLETLLSNLPGVAYRCKNDAQWTMEFVSAGVEDLTGYRVEDFIANQRVSFGKITHPDDTANIWDIVQKALDTRTSFTVQYRIRTESGEERWCYERGRGIYVNDELQAIEGFIADSTEFVRVERELRDKLALIETQRNQIADLSLPIIEVWDGVLTLPVVGTLDANRAARIMEGLLDAVVKSQSEHVIVDLTAVERIDAEVAEHLVGILRAVELLGARGILSGIRPAAAQSLVSLSTNLAGIPTTSDLRGALRFCMKRKDQPDRTKGKTAR